MERMPKPHFSRREVGFFLEGGVNIMSKARNGFIKKLRYICLVGVIALGLITIIGSNGGGGEEGASGDGLTADDINAISTALTAATNAVGDELQRDRSSKDIETKAAYQIAIDVESACAEGGRITASGNITIAVNEDTGEATTFGQITIQVSDPTNNLNDCDVGGGIILDGTLYLTISGTDGDITMTLNGSIGINRRGSGGGLVPITDDCWIYITYSGGNASGSICGHEVST